MVIGGLHVVQFASEQVENVAQSFGVLAVHVTAALPLTHDARAWPVGTKLIQAPGPDAAHVAVPPQGLSKPILKQGVAPPQAADRRPSDAEWMFAGADWLATRPAIAATPNRIIDLIAISPYKLAAGLPSFPFLGLVPARNHPGHLIHSCPAELGNG